jgi:hypothetical protein
MSGFDTTIAAAILPATARGTDISRPSDHPFKSHAANSTGRTGTHFQRSIAELRLQNHRQQLNPLSLN